MARRLDSKDKNFAADFEALLFAKREVEEDVAAGVKRIIADVRARGDAALVELSNKFDRAGVTEATLEDFRRRNRRGDRAGPGGAEGRHRDRGGADRGLS